MTSALVIISACYLHLRVQAAMGGGGGGGVGEGGGLYDENTGADPGTPPLFGGPQNFKKREKRCVRSRECVTF